MGASGVASAALCAFWLVTCAPARPAVTSEALTGQQATTSGKASPRAGAGPGHGIDGPAFAQALDARVDQVLSRPNVDRAFKQLLDSVFDDPTLGEQADRVYTSLSNSQQLSRRLEELQEALMEQPELAELTEAIVVQHPGISPADVGSQIEQHISARADSPEVSHAIQSSLEHLFQRPELARVFDDFGKLVSENPQLVAELERGLRDLDQQRWERRLTELNSGTLPDESRALELLSMHAFNADRLEAFFLAWMTHPDTRAEVVQLCHELLDAPAFQRDALAMATELLSDRAFGDRAVHSFGLLMAPELDERALTSEVQQLFDTRRVAAVEAGFFRALMKDPELAPIGNRALGRLAHSPGFSHELLRLVADW